MKHAAATTTATTVVATSVVAMLIAAIGFAPASAQVTGFQSIPRTGTLYDGADVVANALSIDFTGQYTGSQLLVELDTGTIYNTPADTVGGDIAPNAVFVAIFPDLAFDTFLAQGGLTSAETQGIISLGGAATGISPTETTAVFNDATKISQSYNPAAGTFITDENDFVVAQLTFSPDANGHLDYLAFANGRFTHARAVIINGVIYVYSIPEPATAGVLLLGTLTLTRRRRTRR